MGQTMATQFDIIRNQAEAAARNAAQLEGGLSPREANAILAHMWPLSPRMPRSREAAAVCLADKLCAAAEVLRLWRRLALRRAVLAGFPPEPSAPR